MKNWKKSAVIASLSLALGLCGGYFAHPRLQPKIRKVNAQRNIVESVKNYKGLNPDSFDSKDFIRTSMVLRDDVKDVITTFTANKEGLWVEYETNDAVYDGDVLDYRSFRTLAMGNGKNIRFDTVFDFEGEPEEVTIWKYNPECEEGESYLLSEINLRKEWDGFYINQLLLPNKDFVKIEDEKTIDEVKHLLDTASQNYEKVRKTIDKKNKYPKLVESYEGLSLDSLVSSDFEEHEPIRVGNEENYSILNWFSADKGNLNVMYFRMDQFREGKLNADISFRELGISNFYLNSDPETSEGTPIKFDAYYDIDGSPWAVEVLSYKPNDSEKPNVDKWLLKDKIIFKKGFDGSFYSSYSHGKEDLAFWDKQFTENEHITDSKLLEYVKDLFRIAATNYKTVEGLVGKQ